MSDIFEMMEDGTLCSSCGAWVDGASDGVPRTCEGCEDDE